MILPKIAIAELTTKCNHQCIFCYCPWEAKMQEKSKDLSTGEWKKILTKLRSLGVENITFSGGEATLRKDLFEIINHAKKLNFNIGLISNGKLLSDEFLKKIAPLNIMLSISVPGIETFQETTKTNGIEHTLNLFKKCKDLKIKTSANITVSKKNLHELYENIALPIINGANYILINRFLPGGRGLNNKQYLLSVDEINEMLDIAEEVLSKSGIYGHLGTELPYCVIKNPEKYKYFSVTSLCSAGKGFFVIDPSGYVKVCNHSPKQVCHWTEIDNIKDSDYWNDFINSNYIPDMCKNCEHLNIKCDGGCREAAHVMCGAIDKCDPLFVNNIT